jgi:hypothetical protein
MRAGGVGGSAALAAVLAAALAAVVGGCAVVGHEPPSRSISQPPAELALLKSITAVAKTVNWPGVVEASPVRQAQAFQPADWIVCAQGSARDPARPYALFFDGDNMVTFRLAVQMDDCMRVPYAPVTLIGEPPPAVGGPLVREPPPGTRGPLVIAR